MTIFRLFKAEHIVLWRALSFHGVASNSLFPLLSHRFTVLPTSHHLLTLFVRFFELLRQSTMWIPLINYNTAFHPFFCGVPTTLLPYNSTSYTLTHTIAHKSFHLAPDFIYSNQHYFPHPGKLYSSYSSFSGQSSSTQTFEPSDFFVLSSTSSFLEKYISQKHYADFTFP